MLTMLAMGWSIGNPFTDSLITEVHFRAPLLGRTPPEKFSSFLMRLRLLFRLCLGLLQRELCVCMHSELKALFGPLAVKQTTSLFILGGEFQFRSF